MRLRFDVLAAPARMARRGRVARAAPGFARPLGAPRRDRLVEGVPEIVELVRELEGEKVSKNPTAHGRPGSKRHLVSARDLIPLAVVLTTANLHDSKVFEYLVDATEQTKGSGRGRPSKYPAKPHAAKGYDLFPLPQGAPRAPHEDAHRQKWQAY
jgi:hypothetical protein